jgi:ferrous iron transport protein B
MTGEQKINIALVGQPNVGKSVIFNYLTGLHQHIGNWAGKTIEKFEGTLFYNGYIIDVIDLPGIYSLSTYSVEEVISREYIVNQKPDCVINIADSTNLERNLIFTLQLLELECPVILALNMTDLAKKKGLIIDYEKLQNLLDIPVIPTIAPHGAGITELIDKVIEIKEHRTKHNVQTYRHKIENYISNISLLLNDNDLPYPSRWVAIKLLEKDKEITKLIEEKKPEILEKSKQISRELEQANGQEASILIANERAQIIQKITKEIISCVPQKKASVNDILNNLTTHKYLGYLFMLIILGGMFFTVFISGNWLSAKLEMLFSNLHAWWREYIGTSVLATLGWSVIESVIALIQIAFPYILPFYIILYLLEDWGYISRISFLMDHLMHKMGIHGKGCISFIIGLGCNVPGCLSCRIMESRRERFLTAVLVTLVPCSAVSVIVFGLVGKYVGLLWAFGLYLFAMIVIFVTGRIISKLMIGEPVELIMHMPDYKTPHMRTILNQTWEALKEFIYIAAPIVIFSGVIINAINLAGWMKYIASFLSPVTVKWLGLPSITGILLVFGILRKELILVMLATYLGTTQFSDALSPQQMITLAVISMFYVPCVATISVLWKEYGWKKALLVCFIEIIFAILLAGVISRILNFVL